MEIKTNVTILIPSKKTYCDYAIRMEDVGTSNTNGQWQIIDYMATPARQGYSKHNSFVDASGDAYLYKAPQFGCNLYLFKLGRLTNPILNLFSTGFVRIDMDVKEHIFSPGKESWAKKAELIPQMQECIAIFWQ